MPGFAPLGSGPLGTLPQTSSIAPSGVTGVTVSPSARAASGGETGTLAANVAGPGAPSQAVTWTISAGSITSEGGYTLPAAASSIQTITATATSKQDAAYFGTCVFTIAAAPGVPTGSSGYATYILETFESLGGVPRANLTGMHWYVWAQVAPTPLGAPIAQGLAETTDSAGTSLIDISGQNSVAPGALVTLAFTNSNGDAAQADLMSWFGTVVAH